MKEWWFYWEEQDKVVWMIHLNESEKRTVGWDIGSGETGGETTPFGSKVPSILSLSTPFDPE